LIAQVAVLSQSNYTDASWNALRNALQAAEEIASNPYASQAQVNSALANLRLAYNGLVRTQQGGDGGYRYIFTTIFRSTLWNWLLFFLAFGWIWMWFFRR